MSKIKHFFTSRYKKLLHQIAMAQYNEQCLRLQYGIVLDFRPGHEYDSCTMYVMPCEFNGVSFIKKYVENIGQVIHMDVYDCFGGDVKILAVGADRVFIEIVDVTTCYTCQKAPSPGSKYWVGEWEICDDPQPNTSYSVFEEKDLPF